ncbi:hypothetical protein Lfu02_17400 [Longispora fulva]|uniref:Uncharacterized protein n=1 Tax=Longispora fulva TaxID=619741 RepID=A0A8J7KZ57_9ACTN|nr:hypothetical protein [Longispora fulva]MBG6140252.1 hypothetical protein [Longispora fulva]GIG57368.1 hypothetical protein Lfu02_17400 [Longispora fulva]
MSKRSPEREQFYREVLTTAVEGGINYWITDFRSVERDADGWVTGLTVCDDEGVPRSCDIDGVARGWGLFQGLLKAGQHNGWGTSPDQLIERSGNFEDLDIDASNADDIVQLAIFGEIIYA